MSTEPERYAIITITRHGAALGERLHQLMPAADLYISPKFAAEAPSGGPFPTTVMDLLAEVFPVYDGLIIFISLGAVIRMLAKHLQDKKVDPAVVVVDDKAQFAIAALSGHLGGANALARRVGELLGAQPVITTASDVGGTIAVDLLGREFGWIIDSWPNVTKVSAAVVNQESVGIVQEAGETAWWPADRPLSPNIRVYPDIEAMNLAECAAALLITDRELGPAYSSLEAKSVIYRPKSLVVGVGCTRGTSSTAFQDAVLGTLERHGLSPKSLRCLATTDLKRDEEGLSELAQKLSVPVVYFSLEEINSVQNLRSPSAARRLVGLQGVAEPACLRAAGAEQLLVTKQVVGTVTVAVARWSLE